MVYYLSIYYFAFDRFHVKNTDIRGDVDDVQDAKPSKTYAWKRRRKRQDEEKKEEPAAPGVVLPPVSQERYYRSRYRA